MGRLIFGVTAGVALTLALQLGLRTYRSHEAARTIHLFEVAEQTIEHRLEGTQVLDVSVSPDSAANVPYHYDALYDVVLTYRKSGEIRTITAPFGFAQGTWITPSGSDLAILDESAEVLHSFSPTKDDRATGAR